MFGKFMFALLFGKCTDVSVKQPYLILESRCYCLLIGNQILYRFQIFSLVRSKLTVKLTLFIERMKTADVKGIIKDSLVSQAVGV